MAKYQFLLAFLFVTIVAISAMAIEDSPAESQIPDEIIEKYGSCEKGGTIGCGLSCAVQGKLRGGYCNHGTCICN